MQRIPIRHITGTQKEPNFSKSFSIRNIHGLLAGKDMTQELHRHDFFYILALKKGSSNHDIDFTPYEVEDNSVFFMRPGQVHRILLKAGSMGYLMQFSDRFYFPKNQVSNQPLRKAGHINHYRLTDTRFP